MRVTDEDMVQRARVGEVDLFFLQSETRVSGVGYLQQGRGGQTPANMWILKARPYVADSA
jgi:hypothetical protein